MKQFVCGLGFVVFMVTASLSISQEQAGEDGGQASEANAGEQDQQAAQNGDDDGAEQQAPPVIADQGTFVPSEEISEDLPVSFPVDI